MVVFRQDTDAACRSRLRLVAITLHTVGLLLAGATAAFDAGVFLLMLRHNLLSLLWTYLSVAAYQSSVVAGLMVVVIAIHALSIRLLLSQLDPGCRLTFKQAGEFIMVPLSSVIVVLLAVFLAIAYSVRLERALAVGLLERLEQYDQDASSKLAMDKIQSSFSCCGVNGYNDYMDMSEVDIKGHTNWLPSLRTISSCRPSACLLPLSCCRSLECGQFPQLRTSAADEDFQQEWYSDQGCFTSILASHGGLLQPYVPLAMLLVLLVINILSLAFTQLSVTSHSCLLEADLSEDDSTAAWIFSCGYPSPAKIAKDLADDVIDDKTDHQEPLSTTTAEVKQFSNPSSTVASK